MPVTDENDLQLTGSRERGTSVLQLPGKDYSAIVSLIADFSQNLLA